MSINMLVILFVVGIGTTMNALADEGNSFFGYSLIVAKPIENGGRNSSVGFTALGSFRHNQYYGYEFQGGLFGESWPFTSNLEVDLSAVGFVPLVADAIKLYGKVGMAEVYSRTRVFDGNNFVNHTANNLGMTYGAGVEFQGANAVFRLGFQRIKMGANTFSPAPGTNLIGVTLLYK